jgi:hypothetical protein
MEITELCAVVSSFSNGAADTLFYTVFLPNCKPTNMLNGCWKTDMSVLNPTSWSSKQSKINEHFCVLMTVLISFL